MKTVRVQIAVLWFLAVAGFYAAGYGLAALFRAQDLQGLGTVTEFIGGLLGLAWLGWGLFKAWEVRWVAQLGIALCFAIVVGLTIRLLLAIEAQAMALTVGSVAGALAVLWLGLILIRLLLRGSHPIIGIARTLIEEAARLRVAAVFVLILLISLPALAVLGDSAERLEYKVQTFLSWSLILVGLLLSFMTITLATRSVTYEIQEKQVHLTLTKPVARWQYLTGKLVGLALLNALLVTVGGLAIYGFSMRLSMSEAWDLRDEMAVRDQLLSARVSLKPQPADPDALAQQLGERIQALRLEFPETYGSVDDPVSVIPDNLMAEVRNRVIASFLTLGPGESRLFRFEGLDAIYEANQAANERVQSRLTQLELDEEEQRRLLSTIDQVIQFKRMYFHPGRPIEDLVQNIQDANAQDPRIIPTMTMGGRIPIEEVAGILADRYVAPITLRFTPEGRSDDDRLLVDIRVAGRALPIPPVSEGDPHVQPIPATWIQPDGTLDIRLANPQRNGLSQGSISFSPSDGMQVLVQVGNFGPNLARSLVIVWIRLLFLASLGLAAGAMFSFPVALLACILVYSVAAGSGFLAESLDNYAYFPREDIPVTAKLQEVSGTFAQKLSEGEYIDVTKIAIGSIGFTFSLIVPDFAGLDPRPLLEDGLLVPPRQVFDAAWRLGLVWTLAVGAVGYIAFRRKELAQVIV